MAETVQLEDKVRSLICKQLKVEKEKVTLSASIIEDLDADSLEVVELVMAMEDEFKMSIPEADSEKLKTVGDIVTYIHSKQTH